MRKVFSLSLLFSLIFIATRSTPALAAQSLIELPVMQAILAVLQTQPFFLQQPTNPPAVAENPALKGWDYVYQRLVQHGISPDYLEKIFSDPRMPQRNTLYFSLMPREPHDGYRRRQRRTEVVQAMKFYREYHDDFVEASRIYRVPSSAVLAILQVETRCGSFTGRERVLPQLLRLASAADPANIEENYRKKRNDGDDITLEDVEARAKWLEATFLPHAVATLVLASQQQNDPLEVRGSGAGAIGIGQFLPGNVYRYGVDGDKDGQIDLFNPSDAIHSVANYLQLNGWVQPKISEPEARKVISEYNRSIPYVNLVLYLKSHFDTEIAKTRLPRRTQPTQPS